MSLTQSLNTAISGLNTAQSRIAITSSNIANVNTPGYSRKIVGQETLTLGGMGVGVQVGDIYRSVSEGMLKELRSELGKAGRDEIRNEFYTRLQTMFGTPQSSSSISQRINDLGNAFEQMATTPEQNSPKIQVIESAVQVATTLENLSDQIQQLRNDTDAKIKEETDRANSLLVEISELNATIVRMSNLDQPTTELRDQRDQKVNALSKIMNVNTYTRSDGSMVLFSGNGSRTLLDRTPETLEFTPASGYAPGTGGSGISLGDVDITGELQTGTLRGLLDMRDKDLPQLNDQINELAGELRDAINAEHNKGTAFPPPANLTGTRVVTGTDPVTATGTFRIAALNASGDLFAANSYADIALPTTPATVQGLADAINASAAGTHLTASIVDNRLVIEGLNGARVAINELNSEMTLSDGRTQGLSHYFGLNDFFASAKRSDTMTSIPFANANNALNLTASSFVINAGAGIFNNGGAGITVNYGPNDSLTDVQDNIRLALQGAGLSAADAAEAVYLVNDGSRFRLVIDSDANLSMTDSGTMLETIGMTEDQPNLAGNIEVSRSIFNDPSRLVRGELNASVYESATVITNPSAPIATLPSNPPDPDGIYTISGAFGDVTINYNDTMSLEDIADAINGNATLTNNNITASVVFDSSQGGYILRVQDGDGDAFSFTDSLGTGADSLTTALGLGIKYGVHEGDNRAAAALSGVFDSTGIKFEAAGGLSGATTSLTDFAAGIIASNATKAAAATSDYEFRGQLTSDLEYRLQNEAGVNLDEEMSDLIIFQRAYSASAKVITTVDELFDALLNAV
ncbi:flagellar hook-associated protein FlgK [Thalassospira sp.]|uniref:flagellar hook-associated protein FlgK n=1 Tax=Thalassospira sp. TaxID=1912094 RepID=UPI0027348BD8|nr:flagellar hook-associated protein FlgK [Thalassospira sp.]MDP2696662.1 flagellar hook-associated protein FlgK [Thalassospira sp.]